MSQRFILYNAAYYAQGVIDGLAQIMDNLNIQYTYHTHIGDTNIGGECYMKNPHTHSTYCYPAVNCNRKSSEHPDKPGWWYFLGNCSNGHQVTILELGYLGGGIGYCSRCSFICGIDTSDTYVTSCGKTEETIESATIIY